MGETVVYAIEKGKGLEDLTIPEFRQFSEVVGDDVYEILSLQSCLDKRCAKVAYRHCVLPKLLQKPKQDLLN